MPAQAPISSIALPGDAAGADAKNVSAKWWLSAWVAVPLLVAVVLLSRVPSMSLDAELNPDESQMLAQAMRLGIDPVPWRGMDGTTSGPVNSWALFLLHKAGVPLGYREAHAFAAAILALLVVLTYATLRQIGSMTKAFLGSSMTAVVIALAQGADFTHFSSELVSALLLAAVLLCIALRFRHPGRSLILDCASGVLLGLVPWAKLQAILGAGALAVWLCLQILRGPGWRDEILSCRLRRLLVFGFWLAVPGLFILGTVILGGALEDFWMSYIRANLGYAGGPDGMPLGTRVLMFFTTEQCAGLVQGVAFLAVVWLFSGLPGWGTSGIPTQKLLSAAAVLVAANTVAVLKPPFLFAHYEILLIQPLTLLAGSILFAWRPERSSGPSRKFPVFLFVLWMGGVQIPAVLPAIKNAKECWRRRASVDGTSARWIVHKIRAVAPDVQSMAVWGWMPSVYVEQGIAPATRHAICHYLIEPGPAQAHLRSSFLADIRREKPELLMDAVAAGCFRWFWDSRMKLESFPEFREYVHDHYVLVAELGVESPNDPVRLYLSREYLAARGVPVPP